jgi:hypothetical protein
MAKTAERKSKFIDPYDDTLALFTEGLRNIGLINSVNLLLLVDNKSKKIFKVKKADDVLRHRTNDDVIIFLNENVFERLPGDIKALVVIEALAYISCDLDSGKVEITKPDFEAHSGVLNQHTYPRINVARESIKSVYDVLKQEEDERKAQEAEKKKAKQKFAA